MNFVETTIGDELYFVTKLIEMLSKTEYDIYNPNKTVIYIFNSF